MIQGGITSTPARARQAARRQTGFTLIEVMVVLAVTGLLLFSGLALVNGRQNKTAFMTAINGLQQQVQQVINETASGYFPNSSSFRCTAAGAAQPTLSRLGGNAQGTNGDCVFLGKVLQFGEHDNPDEFIAIPVAGNRQGSSIKGSGVSGGAEPIAVAPTGMPNVPDLTEVHQLQGGLQAGAMYYDGDTSKKTAGVGFMSGDSNGVYSSDDGTGQGTLKSGAQQLSLYAIGGTAVGSTTLQAMAGKINAIDGTNFTHVTSVTVCMVSSVTNQHANLTIGDGNSPTAVSLAILGGTVC